MHDIEKSPTLAYGRLPESFFEPDEEDVSSLPEDLRLMISSIRVFGQLEKSFFIRFCKFIETIELNVGEYLFRIGDEDKYVYVIRSGRIQITVTEPVSLQYHFGRQHVIFCQQQFILTVYNNKHRLKTRYFSSVQNIGGFSVG